MEFKILEDSSYFFKHLPEEWNESIAPYWNEINEKSKIYILTQNNELLCGGIVFSTIIPEMHNYIDEAKYWFSKHYLYIGYVWVPFEKRANSYGSLWIKYLLSLNPSQDFWLTTEEKSLKYFYEKVGFKYIKTLCFDFDEEELFVT